MAERKLSFETDNNNNKLNVASLINLFGSSFKSEKPVIPKKPARIENGRIIWLPGSGREDINDNDSDGVDSCNISIKDRSDTDSDLDIGINTKLNSITDECVNFIKLVLKSLSSLMGFKTALSDKFQDNKEVSVYLVSVFRDVEPFQMLYDMIINKLADLQKQGTFCLPDLFLDPIIKGSLNIYKTFLSQYAINAKWLGEFAKGNQEFKEACHQAKESMQATDLITPESCLYTVFNSLFSFELIFDRYSKCFEDGNEYKVKAEKVKELISGLLNVINSSIDKENFFTTHKELHLLIGRTRETKITTRFICKFIATKMSRRDDKALCRMLVLFSDCLYVTLLPGNISGTSSVRQELSLEWMTLSRISDDDEKKNNLKWGLNIYAREADQDFYFEDEDTLNNFFSKLEGAISSLGDKKPVLPNQSRMPKLGEEAPRWQKDSSASICNGHNCDIRFTSTSRRHHCRADGLLYCDSCCSSKIKLKFERAPESRVCQLCYRILLGAKCTQAEDARRQLDLVFKKKTRTGKKTDWIKEQVYSPEKKSFSPPASYFCELDETDPFMRFYKKHEDKYMDHGLMLLGMLIKVGKESKYCQKMKPTQFIIEHQDMDKVFMYSAANPEIRDEWVKCLRESISNYCNM